MAHPQLIDVSVKDNSSYTAQVDVAHPPETLNGRFKFTCDYQSLGRRGNDLRLRIDRFLERHIRALSGSLYRNAQEPYLPAPRLQHVRSVESRDCQPFHRANQILADFK